MLIWVLFGYFLLCCLFSPKGHIPKPQVCTSSPIWRAGHADFFLCIWHNPNFPWREHKESWAGEDSHLSHSMHCGWENQERFCQCKAPTKHLGRESALKQTQLEAGAEGAGWWLSAQHEEMNSGGSWAEFNSLNISAYQQLRIVFGQVSYTAL